MNPGRFQPGTDVWSPWGTDPHLYAAIVLGVDPQSRQAFVVFWEGNTAGVPDAELRPLSIQPGMRVQANILNDNNYLPGVIVSRTGGAVNVQLDDGRSVWCAWAKCRIPR